MKSVLFLVFVVVGGCAFADLIPFEVIRPMPLHRIGIDILAEVVGALTVGGLAIKQLVAKYEKMKKSGVQDIEGERQRYLSGDITIAAGGEFVRIEETEDQCEDVAFEMPHVFRWRELGADERQALKSKLDNEMRVFESIYDKMSGAWLREADLPSQWTEEREEWWGQKCKELVFSVLLHDDKLRNRLKGVPIEWILSRMDKPTRRKWREGFVWLLVRLLEEFGKFSVKIIDLVGGACSSEYRYGLSMKSGFWHRKMRRERLRFCCLILIVLVYLSGVIAMASGVVDVVASCVTTRVFKIVFYPLLPLIGGFVFLLASCIALELLILPLYRWHREKKVKCIFERRSKFFSAYRGERRFRIPVPDLTLSRQQMQMLPRDVVLGIIGSAKDASLSLKYAGIARHHAEIYFNKAAFALGGSGFAMRGLGGHGVCNHVVGRFPEKEKYVFLHIGCEICVGPYAILKVVSVPTEKDNAFVFELVDGKRRDEKVAKMPQPDTSTVQWEPSENTVPFVCDDVHKQTPFVVGEQGGIVFGRSQRSDVRLYEQDVSGRHLEIVREGSQFIAVCLSRQGMDVNDKAVEPSGRRPLHEGDCIRIGKNTEVRLIRLPKNGDDVMVANVKDSRATREEEVRLPMVAEGVSRKVVADERLGHGCEEDAQHSLGVTRSASSEELSVRMADLCEVRKPVIYFYPEKETTCNARVITDGALTCTYPAQGTDGWRGFVAAPDGTLTFPDGRQYYCLYWEGTTPTRWDFSQGYCVRGSETSEFLADILAKMGLSFREANEFIIYWLPRMQNNPYNVIAFQGENYAQSAMLEIMPKPDGILRVFMAWKASDRPIDIPAPDIKPSERKGFTVVEWGGTEVGN